MRVLFAGGGTGGHLYPNLAVAEALRTRRPTAEVRFLVSDRPGDRRILDAAGETGWPSPVRPLPRPPGPTRSIRFVRAWLTSVAHAAELLRRERIDVVVTSGGFVSGPAVEAGRRADIPTALVNLDAIAGIASRWLSSRADAVFTAAPSRAVADATAICVPLRAAALVSRPAAEARVRLGLAPDRPTLFVTGATHGGRSLVEAVVAWVRRSEALACLQGWQVLHQIGTLDRPPLAEVYRAAGLPVRLVDYVDEMGDAWSAADLAVARAGAGTVAEAWEHGVPSVFVPNPHHREQRVGRNAAPLVAAGGALIVAEADDAARTADRLQLALAPLLTDADRRARMGAALRASRPRSGAEAVADWVLAHRSADEG